MIEIRFDDHLVYCNSEVKEIIRSITSIATLHGIDVVEFKDDSTKETCVGVVMPRNMKCLPESFVNSLSNHHMKAIV